MKKFYLHTVGGKPGWFDGEQIVYAERRDHWQDDYNICVLATSIKQLRDEQKRSREYRESKGWYVSDYGFVIVSVEGGIIRWRPK